MGSRRARPLGSALVGAVALLAVAAGVFLVGDGGSDRVEVTGGTGVGRGAESRQGPREPQPRVVETPSTNVPRGPAVVSPPGPQPSRAVVVTDDGRLVVLEVASGRELRELVARPLRTGPEADPVSLGGVSLSPDGSTVFYAACCSPAVGSTRRVAVTGGEPVLVADGRAPSVSPDGEALAVIDPILGVKFVSIDGRFLGLVERRTGLAPPESVAWSPDGQKLVVALEGRLIVLEATDTALSQGLELEPPSGRRWSSPVSRADGSLLAVEAAAPGSAGSVRVLGPDGTMREVVDLGGRTATSLGVDPTGGWVAVATADQTLMAIGPDGTVTATAVRGGVRSVDW